MVDGDLEPARVQPVAAGAQAPQQDPGPARGAEVGGVVDEPPGRAGGAAVRFEAQREMVLERDVGLPGVAGRRAEPGQGGEAVRRADEVTGGEEVTDRADPAVVHHHPHVPHGVPDAEGAQDTGEVGPGAPADPGGVAPQVVDGYAEGAGAVPYAEFQMGRHRRPRPRVRGQHEAPLQQDPAPVRLAAGEPVHQPQLAERAVLVAELGDVERGVGPLALPVHPPVVRHGERRGHRAPSAQRVRHRQHTVRVAALQQPHAGAFDGRQGEQDRLGNAVREHPGGRRGDPVPLGGGQQREGPHQRYEVVERERPVPLLTQSGLPARLEEVARPAVRLDESGDVPAVVGGGTPGDDPAAYERDTAHRRSGLDAEQDLAAGEVLPVAQGVPFPCLTAQAEAGHQGVVHDESGGVGEPLDAA